MVVDGYDTADYYDEIFDAQGNARGISQAFVRNLRSLTDGELQRRQLAADRNLHNMGITFTVYGNEAGTEKVWPFDIIPRILDGGEWDAIEVGLKQLE
ncbi:MAG: hypothetical protein JJ992_20160 [Planctomycetes bacterium]|nr:hypothetical protein [Planctomycetota bacterium]